MSNWISADERDEMYKYYRGWATTGRLLDHAAEADRRISELQEALLKYADAVERDRYEPDKILCNALSMRRAAQRVEANNG